jgi:hypothetical protein
MSFVARHGRVGAMSEGSRQTFVLQVDAGSTPIVGLLAHEGREPVEFAGWLGLAAALEGLIEATAPSAPVTARRNHDTTNEPRSRRDA